MRHELTRRMVTGNIVNDQEVVTRTFPEGTGSLEFIATYLVREG